jgi:hypothetical protein
MPSMTTLLFPHTAHEVSADGDGDALWLSTADLLDATGYELKPEGFCLADVCVPVPPGRDAEFVRETAEGQRANVAAFWRYLGAPVVHDEAGATWSLGDPPDHHAARIDSIEAPDFTLPDASGRLHSLSDYRGTKVLLAAWASW